MVEGQMPVPKRRSQAGRWLLLGGVGMLGAAMTSSGVFASWVATAQNTSGSVQAAALGVTHTDTNGTVFSSGVTNLLPGDYLYRYAKLVNTGGLAQDFVAAIAGSGVMAGAGGLQIAVDSCSLAWAGDGSCAGTLLPVATVRDVASAGTITLGQIAANGTSYLRYEMQLSATADQTTLQGATGSLTVTISGTTPVSGGRDRTAG